MMYIVHYFDENYKEHTTFVKTFKDVENLKKRFGEVTVEAHKVK